MFTTYEEVFKGVLMNGNNINCWIAGIGMVRIKLIDGRVIRTYYEDD